MFVVFRASLVPVISFGENELYRRYKNITWGRFIFGHIPLRRPVVTVGKWCEFFLYKKKNRYSFLVGKPIHIEKNLNATPKDINQLHENYIQAVQHLFDYNKNKYGLEHVELEIM